MKRFYCQGCGEEVPLNSDSCPHCFKEFDSVLCPSCNYRGKASGFYNGCPKCGYLSEVVRDGKNIKKSKNIFHLTLKTFLILLVPLIGLIIFLLYLLMQY